MNALRRHIVVNIVNIIVVNIVVYYFNYLFYKYFNKSLNYIKRSLYL